MVEIFEVQAHTKDGICLIDPRGVVWRTFSRPWWCIASWLWYWLAPGEKRVVHCIGSDGARTRIRAIRIGERHLFMGRR